MDERADAGLAIRREVLGDEYVDRAPAQVDDFGAPLQELVTHTRALPPLQTSRS
jgi:hypothetical protein